MHEVMWVMFVCRIVSGVLSGPTSEKGLTLLPADPTTRRPSDSHANVCVGINLATVFELGALW